MKFTIGPFKGRAPKLADHLLPAGHGSIATNARLTSGNLAPLRGPALVLACSKAGTIQSIYRYKDAGNDYWLHWTGDVDAVLSPINEDTHKRIYFTGDGIPQVASDITALTGAGTDYPYNAYTLGLPKPAGAITLDKAPVADGGDYPPANAVSTVYAYRFVSDWGEPGPLGSASALITIGRDSGDGHKEPIRLAGFDTSVTGDYNIANIEIYRANAASTLVDWQYVDTIAFGSATYDDVIEDIALGDVLPAEEYLQPPGTMQGLIPIHSAMMAGFNDKEVLVSFEELPHGWPAEYRFAVPDPVVGLGHFGNTILVMTEGFPYMIQGQHPVNMVKTKLDVAQACVSKRGIVDVGNGVIYPSPDGLMAVGVDMKDLITKDIIDREFWQSLKPESIMGTVHNGMYIGFYDTGAVKAGFVFDPATSNWIDLEFHATAAHYDRLTDELFLVVADVINKWDSGTNLTVAYRGPLQVTPRLVNMGHGQVVADTYPVTFRLYGDGILRHTRAVVNDEPFTMPGDYKARKWYQEVETAAGEVESCSIAETIEELNGKN